MELLSGQCPAHMGGFFELVPRYWGIGMPNIQHPYLAQIINHLRNKRV